MMSPRTPRSGYKFPPLSITIKSRTMSVAKECTGVASCTNLTQNDANQEASSTQKATQQCSVRRPRGRKLSMEIAENRYRAHSIKHSNVIWL